MLLVPGKQKGLASGGPGPENVHYIWVFISCSACKNSFGW